MFGVAMDMDSLTGLLTPPRGKLVSTKTIFPFYVSAVVGVVVFQYQMRYVAAVAIEIFK